MCVHTSGSQRSAFAVTPRCSPPCLFEIKPTHCTNSTMLARRKPKDSACFCLQSTRITHMTYHNWLFNLSSGAQAQIPMLRRSMVPVCLVLDSLTQLLPPENFSVFVSITRFIWVFLLIAPSLTDSSQSLWQTPSSRFPFHWLNTLLVLRLAYPLQCCFLNLQDQKTVCLLHICIDIFILNVASLITMSLSCTYHSKWIW